MNLESRATENRYIKYCAYILIFSATGFLLNIMPSVTSALYTTSAIVFVTIQMTALNGWENTLAKYMQVALKVASVCFILAGLLMLEDTHMLLFDILPLKVWLDLCHDKWVYFLLFAFILEMYASDKLYKNQKLYKEYIVSKESCKNEDSRIGLIFILNILGMSGFIFSALAFTGYVLVFVCFLCKCEYDFYMNVKPLFPLFLSAGFVCSVVGLLGKSRYLAVVGCILSASIVLGIAFLLLMIENDKFY